MPYCPTCRGEFLPQVSRCPTCETALVQTLAADAMDVKRERMAQAVADGKVVAVTRGSIDACEEVVGALEAASIPAKVVKPQDDCEHEGGHPCNHFGVVVLEEDVEATARALRGRFDDLLAREGVAGPSGSEAGDACPACGTKVAEDVAECPDCGLAFG